MTIAAIIPARGGSKGLPDKNLAQIGGKSLVAHAVAVAQSVPRLQKIVVSSDSDRILEEARSHGATPLRRPDDLSSDTATIEDMITHHLSDWPDVSVVVILQPTSPLRSPEDVERCLNALSDAPSAVTVTPLEHPPEWTFRLDDEGLLEPLFGWDGIPLRRQDAEAVFMLNGAVYAARAGHLRAGGKLMDESTRAIVMPRERSVDIEDAVDLELARAFFTIHGQSR